MSQEGGEEEGGYLERCLSANTTHLVFIDEGFRPRQNSPLWKSRDILLVVSTTNWRGKPPKDWWACSSVSTNHYDLGGVTTGKFELFLARSLGKLAPLCHTTRPCVLTKLKHVLDTTVQGTRCPIPKEKTAPLGQDATGRLLWERRLYRVEAPTVFSKVHWVRRKLTPKELATVLDLPRASYSQKDALNFLARIHTPGKVRADLVRTIREWIKPESKNPRMQAGTELGGEKKRQKIEGKRAGLETARESSADEKGQTVTVKSTKSDDASVPIHLWNDRCLAFGWFKTIPAARATQALSIIRDLFCLRFWKRKVARDLFQWLLAQDKAGWWEDSTERLTSSLAGRKAIRYAAAASWWEWDGGSFPFFWRWDPVYLREIRDGLPPRFLHQPPACMDRQRPNSVPEFAVKERAKVFKVVKRGYLRLVPLSELNSLMHYFSVPKGDDDIRMVYDGSKCGLNAATFAPWFAVPTSSTLERTVVSHTVQGDNDFGDMFLNFKLHLEMQKYTGVDGTDLLNDPEALAWLKGEGYDISLGIFFTWDRPAMGMTGSPYQSVQTGTRGKRMILGNKADATNPFHWDGVLLNLPGQSSYDPRMPWIYKVRPDGSIAADLHTYIDDNRVTANTDDEAWAASSRIAKVCSWLGMQDAARKRRAPSREPGAWAGTIIRTRGDVVEKMVSQERWDKTKDKLKWIRDQLQDRPEGRRQKLLHKTLESIRGFLVYVTRTYPEMVPYLKGIHLTLDSWRKGRSKSGWKTEVMNQANEEGCEDLDGEGCEITNSIDDKLLPSELTGRGDRDRPPTFVFAVPRLQQDVDTLTRLTSTPAPPAVLVRPCQVMVGYLVGDASGSGHGTSFLYTGSETLDLTHGTWSEEAARRSSNFRELANLVRRVEQLVEQGRLRRGTELFVFTDNFVTESVFYKGAATSPYLHSLVERLKMLQLHGGLFIHMIWIAGTRMIEQGTDGLSRGDFNSGILAGRDFLSLIPLDKTALELSPELENWIRKTLPGRMDWEVLAPEGWYTRGHEDGHFIWSPAPAIADAALEQMCDAILSLGESRGPNDWLGDKTPCQKCGAKIGPLKGIYCGNYGYLRSPQIPICYGAWHAECYRKDPQDSYPVLQAKDIEDALMDDEELVDDDPARFQEARNGDHLMCPFQCDWCHFINIHRCVPNLQSGQDRLCLLAIRRATLDSLWARERATVEANRREAQIFVREGMTMGVVDPYPPRGPWAIEDSWGVKTALVILQRSLAPGKNAAFVQYETIRKTRSHVSNFFHTVPGGMGEMFIASESSVSGMTRSPTNSLWFKRFMQGCHRRMGDVWCPDRPVTIREALAIQEDLEKDWEHYVQDRQGRLKTAITGVMITAGLGGGMRGEELNRVDLGIIRKHWKAATLHVDAEHVPLGMVGRFKRTVGEKVYIQPLAVQSVSGLQYKLWMHRMICEYAAAGVFTGPVFRRVQRRATDKVERARVGDINLLLHPALGRVQARLPNLIGEEVKIEDVYSASRSFKRGATAQARNMDIPQDVIAANNRWRQKERSRGSTPHMTLLERYSDARASVPLLIKFSGGL